MKAFITNRTSKLLALAGLLAPVACGGPAEGQGKDSAAASAVDEYIFVSKDAAAGASWSQFSADGDAANSFVVDVAVPHLSRNVELYGGLPAPGSPSTDVTFIDALSVSAVNCNSQEVSGSMKVFKYDASLTYDPKAPVYDQPITPTFDPWSKACILSGTPGTFSITPPPSGSEDLYRVEVRVDVQSVLKKVAVVAAVAEPSF
jgi:hypothetical protein